MWEIEVDLVEQWLLALGGDKAQRWKTWYRENIPIADDRYDEHLRHLRER